MAEDTFNLFYPWFYQGEMSVEILNYKKELGRGRDRLEYNKNEYFDTFYFCNYRINKHYSTW